MGKQKIFILLPDGIGLRNFAFTEFYNLGLAQGFDIVFWNNTPFDLTGQGFEQIPISGAKTHPMTDILKNARIAIELDRNIKRSSDKVYDSYRFPLSYRNTKSAFKSLMVRWFSTVYNSGNGLKKISQRIVSLERGTPYYKECLETLKRERPAMVFCTNQRITLAIAPLAAAKDLGIPTATFIFSWDNLPKATKVIETDYYFVWSAHMKLELMFYYPDIRDQQIFVTGTPQFEAHFNPDFIIPKDHFFKEYGLDPGRKYLCFSGDDITTSPNDPDYLADTAAAVRTLNAKGYGLGIIFRRCPVDFSGRYDAVLSENADIIRSIAPKWQKLGEGWNTMMPTKEDTILLTNTVYHSEMVINLGSSMVFDYAAHGKPCGFINYDVPNSKNPVHTVEKIYKFIHFRSMPDKKAVFWLNSPAEIAGKIEEMLTNGSDTVAHAKRWFEKITQHPPQAASGMIWNGVRDILNKQ